MHPLNRSSRSCIETSSSTTARRGVVSPVRKKEMQSVVEVGSFGFDTRLPAKRSSRSGAFVRWFRSITHLGSESLETTIGRAVEQAFAEFAKEMHQS